MKTLFSLLPFLFLLASAHAQMGGIGYFRQGEKLFRDGNFDDAAPYFEKYLIAGKRNAPRAQPFVPEKKANGRSNLNPKQTATYHLAECYRHQNDLLRAEKWYASTSRSLYPESHYWYAVCLRADGYYAQAVEELTAFEKEYTGMGPILLDADRELGSLRFIQAQQGKEKGGLFRLSRQATTGKTSAYAPAMKGDTLVFTAIRAVADGYRNELYTATPTGAFTDSTLLTAAAPLTLPSPDGSRDNHRDNQGLATFSADGKHIFFTRWTKLNDKTHAAIWTSQYTDTGWSQPVALSSSVNREGYSSAQPFLTPDGQYLLFSSDRPGGQGRFDCWFASLDSSYNVIMVSNMGPQINTPGDDESPYYHLNTRTLVFASNGRIGMGGFDLYQSKGRFDLSQWTIPENAGVPVNSSRDDLYYISTDEDNVWNTGWLSSDRGSGCCLALYSVQQNNTQYITGRIVDVRSHRPLSGAALTLKDPHHGGKVLTDGHTDSLGVYHFVLKNTSRVELVAQQPDYLPGAGNYLIRIETGKDTLDAGDLALHRVPVADSVIAHSSIVGNFPYKRSSLPLSARVVLDSLAGVLSANPDYRLQIEGYTDGVGGDAYNIRLGQQRVNVCIRYLLKKGIGADRLIGKSFGKCCPLAPDTIDGKDNPAGREINRRVEYKLIRVN